MWSVTRGYCSFLDADLLPFFLMLISAISFFQLDQDPAGRGASPVHEDDDEVRYRSVLTETPRCELQPFLIG